VQGAGNVPKHLEVQVGPQAGWQWLGPGVTALQVRYNASLHNHHSIAPWMWASDATCQGPALSLTGGSLRPASAKGAGGLRVGTRGRPHGLNGNKGGPHHQVGPLARGAQLVGEGLPIEGWCSTWSPFYQPE
jgi:hypothetical protein